MAEGGQEGDKGLRCTNSCLWKRKGSSSQLVELKPNVPGDLPETLCQEGTQQVVGVPHVKTFGGRSVLCLTL